MKSRPDTSQPLKSQPGRNPPRVLITAGPTHEPIDAVRYIANRSSGRMGLALGQAAIDRGWTVTLLLGPVTIQPPEHSQLTVTRFQTAADLHRLLQELWPSNDLLLMAAAVADFTPAKPPQNKAVKIKRTDQSLTLELRPTPDILASLASVTRPDQTVIGFALESAADLAIEATRKLQSKRLDAIVANPLDTMDSPDVTAAIYWRDGRIIAAPASMPKQLFATWLLEQIEPSPQRKPE